jgi:hypothetical protein
LGVRIPELLVSLGISINECVDSELLRKSIELTRRRRSLGEIDEMSFYAALGEEAQCLASVRVLLQTEYLNFHGQEETKVRERAMSFRGWIRANGGNLPRW